MISFSAGKSTNQISLKLLRCFVHAALFVLLFLNPLTNENTVVNAADENDVDRLDYYLFGRSDDFQFLTWGGYDLRILPLVDAEYISIVLGTIGKFEELSKIEMRITNSEVNVIVIIEESFESAFSKYGNYISEVVPEDQYRVAVDYTRATNSQHFVSYLYNAEGLVIFALAVIEAGHFSGEGISETFWFPWTKVAMPITEHALIPGLSPEQVRLYYEAPLEVGMTRSQVLGALRELGT